MVVPVSLNYTENDIYMLAENNLEAEENSYIKWMSFDVPNAVMTQALKYDISMRNTETPVNWIELIAYSAAKNWGSFEKDKKSKTIDEAVKKIAAGAKMEELTKGLKLYDFYYEIYMAVLTEFAGEYEKVENGETIKKYGIKAFSPIASGYSYTHYDDFGRTRTYGYKRRHLGNDLMGSVGVPIIAIEDGYIEAIGWNQYGGWRIGIRSADKKRYYYYAHLRKGHPFTNGLKEGDYVKAGDCIGYLGMTGYSKKEDVNNIDKPHLHFGMQIIFDEKQKEGNNQIWIDVYEIINFLSKNRMPVVYDETTKDYVRAYETNNIPTD